MYKDKFHTNRLNYYLIIIFIITVIKWLFSTIIVNMQYDNKESGFSSLFFVDKHNYNCTEASSDR